MKRYIVFVCVYIFLLLNGVASQASNFRLSGTVEYNHPLRTDSVQQLKEVVITGTNMADSPNRIPFSLNIISSKTIENSGESKVLMILSGRVPSLFITERGVAGFGISTGGSGGIKIRGVGGNPTNQVLMMVDGQPQFAGIFSHHVADAYTSDFVERVEVIRGPASVLYGSNAMGGVINVITKNACKEGVHSMLSAQYGSYNTSNYVYTNQIREKRFHSVISLNYDRTDGQHENFDFKQGGGYVKVGYDFSREWNASVDYTLSRFEGTDPSYATAIDPVLYTQHIVRGATSLNVNNHYGSTEGTVKLFYSYGNHYIYDPKPFHSLDDHLGVIAYQSFSLGKGNSVTAGFDYTHYTGKIPLSGGNPYSPENMTTFDRKVIDEMAPYVVASQSLWHDFLVVNGGLRYVFSEKFGNSLIPQGGITIMPESFSTLKFSVAKGYRNPSMKELYLYKMANPDLKPETMMNYEVSFTQWLLSKQLRFELTGYLSKGRELIQTMPHPELGHMLNENTGKFTNKGIETSVSYALNDNWQFHSTYSYLHTSLSELTGAPKNQFFFGVDGAPLKQLRVSTQLKYTGSLFVAKEMDRQNYLLWNMRLSYFPQENIEIYGLFDNLLDKRYTINYGYPMPGFMAFGGLKIHF